MQLRRVLLFGAATCALACGIAALDRQPKPTNALIASAAPNPTANATSSAAVVPAAQTVAIVAPPPAIALGSKPPGHFIEALDVSTFQRGNLHTHTKLSDGDADPETVIKWYRDNGYNFLAITDHNSRTDPARFKKLERPGFVLVGAEEVTMNAEHPTGVRPHAPIHMNAICSKTTIGGGHFATPVDALKNGLARIHRDGAIALVNHPNFDWALTPNDVFQAKGAELLEIASGHPWVYTDGDKTHPSHEAIWDMALSRGIDFAGVAVDDSHNYNKKAPEHPARPGKGWVQVFAAKPEPALICDALRAGKLYSSTGPKIARIMVSGPKMEIGVEDKTAEVTFIGQNGTTLATVTPNDKHVARYELQGGEEYVRAKVTTRDGKHAWTQAYRVTD